MSNMANSLSSLARDLRLAIVILFCGALSGINIFKLAPTITTLVAETWSKLRQNRNIGINFYHHNGSSWIINWWLCAWSWREPLFTDSFGNRLSWKQSQSFGRDSNDPLCWAPLRG